MLSQQLSEMDSELVTELGTIVAFIVDGVELIDSSVTVLKVWGR